MSRRTSSGQIRSPRLLALLLALVVGGCSTTPAEPDPPAMPPDATVAQASGLFYAFIRQPIAIEPIGASEGDDLLVVAQLFEPLTRIDVGMRVIPGAAASWESDEGGRVFRFHLRPDATFHDGTPVTASAFVRAWELAAERQSAVLYLLDAVAGIDEARRGEGLPGVVAHDDHTLEVRLIEPTVEFPAIVSHPSLAPLPRAAIERVDFGRMPVGNGPFRMTEPWQPGRFIRLEPYEGHPDAPLDVDQVVFRIYEGEDAVAQGYEDFLRGTLDFAPLPADRHEEAVTRFRRRDGYSGPGVVDGVRTTVVYHGFNVHVPPFDDPQVRRAIALLADRVAIAEAAGASLRAPLESVVPPIFPGYEPPACPYCGPDAERALLILERAGIAAQELQGLELVHLDAPEHEKVAERIAADVNGVLGDGTIELRALTQAEWLAELRDGRAGFFLAGWMAEYPSPSSFLQPLFGDGPDNLSRFHASSISDALTAARGQIDDERRAELLLEAEMAALHGAAVVPLYAYRHAKIVSERTHGLRFDALGRLDLRDISLIESP